MAKLYYGNGSCTIEGSDIRGVEILYRGAIEIEDKTSDSFAITYGKDKIIIFPIDRGTLNDLFDYIGEFRIISAIVADNNAEKVPTTIHRVMDYTELLETNAEDMTTKSEDLSSTYVSGNKVAKTILRQPYLNNRHTSKNGVDLYLQNGLKYKGYFHIHLADNSAMTGKEHTQDSQDLYFNHGKPTKNTGVPYGAIEQEKIRKRNSIEISTRKGKRRNAQLRDGQ